MGFRGQRVVFWFCIKSCFYHILIEALLLASHGVVAYIKTGWEFHTIAGMS